MIKKYIIHRFKYCAYVVSRLRDLEDDEYAQRLISEFRFNRYAKFRSELRDYERLPRWFSWLRIMIAKGEIPKDTNADEVEYRNKMSKKLKGPRW